MFYFSNQQVLKRPAIPSVGNNAIKQELSLISWGKYKFVYYPSRPINSICVKAAICKKRNYKKFH